eukprot:TRINITY_DN169_c0_g1_i1.p1 TRINITY_DN169_c0_g1~~TRINITY_DN169_c0_g1_i1.p1  ORF type:complete len:274 (-),score=35.63 TRINITY_DN169_c0_g1_i1:257-1078(-)
MVGSKYQRDHYFPQGFEVGETNLRESSLSRKMIADIVESLIGACYNTRHGHEGIVLAQKFMKTLEMDVQFPEITPEFENHPGLEENMTDLTTLQEILGYRFKDVTYLKVAMTHSSISRTENLQRLEFLGDAILDMLIVDYNFPKYPKASPGSLSLMKSYIVRNDTLAFISVSHDLCKFLYHESSGIESGVTKYHDLRKHNEHHTKRILDNIEQSDTSLMEIMEDETDESLSVNEFLKIVQHLQRLDEIKGHIGKDDMKSNQRPKCRKKHKRST